MCALAVLGLANAKEGVRASNSVIAMRNFMEQTSLCLYLFDAQNREPDSNIEATNLPKRASSPTTFGDG
jgi:hypothetical protein